MPTAAPAGRAKTAQNGLFGDFDSVSRPAIASDEAEILGADASHPQLSDDTPFAQIGHTWVLGVRGGGQTSFFQLLMRNHLPPVSGLNSHFEKIFDFSSVFPLSDIVVFSRS